MNVILSGMTSSPVHEAFVSAKDNRHTYKRVMHEVNDKLILYLPNIWRILAAPLVKILVSTITP